jgi:hypothetical protein
MHARHRKRKPRPVIRKPATNQATPKPPEGLNNVQKP